MNQQTDRGSGQVEKAIETCRKLGLNPEEYLLAILPQLPDLTNHTARDYTPAQRIATRENQ